MLKDAGMHATTTGRMPPTTVNHAVLLDDTLSYKSEFEQHEVVKLAPDIESQVASVLANKDPLDSQDFDPVTYMNALFPNGKCCLFRAFNIGVCWLHMATLSQHL